MVAKGRPDAQITAMLWLVLGAATLLLFLGGLRAFEQASVATIKSLVIWIVALAGASLALLLVLTGREAIAIGALTFLGPLIWSRWRAVHPTGLGAGARTSSTGGGQQTRARSSGTMSKQEAYEVLGLAPGASEADIRAAHHRLMRTAHPDSGGSDWLAARINMARDILLGSRHA
jgi:DnaJ homolog subfamily C member 19